MDYLIELGMHLLQKNNQIISERINKEFATSVNAFGVCHRSQTLFAGLSLNFDANAFAYISYFFIPANKKHSVILPKAFVYKIRKFQNAADSVDTKEAYYKSLSSFEQLAAFVEQYTSGATVYCDILTDIPFDNWPVITDVNKAEDVAYLIARYYSC